MTPSNPSTDTAATDTSLRGTPVVPGVAYGPVLVAATEVSPDAVAAFAAQDARARRRAGALRRGGQGGVRPARRARRQGQRFRRRGAHRHRRAWPATRGCAAPSPAGWRGSTPALRAQRQRGPVRRAVHPDGRADGRAGHRPARPRAAAHRRDRRRAGAGRAHPRGAERARRRGPRARRHCRPRRRAGAGPRHRAGRPDQPHRDHRPAAGHPLRRRRARRAHAARRHERPRRRRLRRHRGRARRRVLTHQRAGVAAAARPCSTRGRGRPAPPTAPA